MEGYGAPEELEAALSAAVERGEHEAARIRALAGAMREPFVRLRDEGHAEIWAGAAECVSVRGEHWRALARR
jgi:hypothetical protein